MAGTSTQLSGRTRCSSFRLRGHSFVFRRNTLVHVFLSSRCCLTVWAHPDLSQKALDCHNFIVTPSIIQWPRSFHLIERLKHDAHVRTSSQRVHEFIYLGFSFIANATKSCVCVKKFVLSEIPTAVLCSSRKLDFQNLLV